MRILKTNEEGRAKFVLSSVFLQLLNFLFSNKDSHVLKVIEIPCNL